jgi:4-diphosphocytidyl-2-C-methyl-D-erythritol kinase
VTGRRPDGYHLLDTVAVFADFGGRVTIAPAEQLSLEVSGPFAAHAPGDERDLAWRAAEAFFAHTGLPPRAAISVEKNIPAGAGLGGGSADAAAVLRGLDVMFGTGLRPAELAMIGIRLGADVPMCLVGRALRARGIGEDIEMLEAWPPLPLVLAWPGQGVSTAEAFRRLESRDNAPLSAAPLAPMTARRIATWLGSCRNDLEGPAERLAPCIRDVRDMLGAVPGCLLARMSGSGSACFGLFADPAEALSAASVLASVRRDWWVIAGSAH